MISLIVYRQRVNVLSTTEATPERLAGRTTGDDERTGSEVTNTLRAFADNKLERECQEGIRSYVLASSFSIV